MPKRIKHPIARLRYEQMKAGDYRAYMEISHPTGKRTRESLGIICEKNPLKDTRLSREDKARHEQAKAIVFKLEQEHRARYYGLETPEKPDPEFIAWVLQKDSSYRIKNMLRYLKAYAGERIMTSQITPDFVEGFVAFLSKTDLAQNSRREYFNRFKAMYAKLRRLHRLPHDPFEFAKAPKSQKTSKEFLTVPELQAFMNHCQDYPEEGRIFLAMCLTGLRKSDMKTLTFKELRDGRKRTQKTKDLAIIDNTHPFFTQLLQNSQHRKDDELVYNYSEKRMIKAFAEVGAKAGIRKKITAHTARYTNFHLHHSTGTGLETIRKLLTHSSLATTSVYARSSDDELKQAQNKLHDLIKFDN